MWRTKRNDLRRLMLLSRNLQNLSTASSFVPAIGSSSSGHQHERHPNRFPVGILTSAFIAAAIFSAASSSSSHCDADDNKKERKALPASEVPIELRQRLKKVREPLGRNYPTVTFSHDGNQQTLGILLDVRRDVNGLLKSWTDIFGDETVIPAELSEKTRQFISHDKKKRMYVRRNENRTTSVWIVHDDGFCSDDLQKITDGYAVSCAPSTFSSPKDHSSSSSSSSSSSKGFPFEFTFHLGASESLDDEDYDGSYEDKGKTKLFPLEFFKSQKDPSFRHHGAQTDTTKTDGPSNAHDVNKPVDNAMTKLRRLGVDVFDQTLNADLSWDCLAGYDHVKQEIEETIVNSLKYPDIYDRIARNTRVSFESNRPKAVLLEGPPGTGKTLTARILASRCDRPLVHLKLEDFVSKWYGDSEKKLASIFDACDELEGTIIFIDEVDSVAGSRDNSHMHEATRRILSVVLQRVEGFKGKGKSLLICATNRRSDLDAALLSRFDLSIKFELPDFETRKKVLARYARQFSGTDLSQQSALDTLAAATTGLSCRDIKETCEHAERRLASKLIVNRTTHTKNQHDKENKDVSDNSTVNNIAIAFDQEVPTMENYLTCISQRKGATNQQGQGLHSDREAFNLTV